MQPPIQAKSTANCNEHFTESIFQIRFRVKYSKKFVKVVNS
ncbi:DUF6783 domain-containing protein [Anaerobutyricum hallii]